MNRFKTTLKVSLLAVLSLCIVACGDSNNDLFVNSANYGANGGANFIGNFLGANRLNNGQTATLNMTVAQGGATTGNFTVTNPPVLAQTLTIPGGTFAFTGNVDPSTGAFSLSGNFPGVGPFTITGVLSAGGTQGTYAISINGTAFQGVIQPAALGAPNLPPVGGGSGDLRAILGGSLSNFVFNPAGGYNGDNPPVALNTTVSGALANNQANGPQSLSLVLAESQLVGQQIRVKTFAITITDQNNDIAQGAVYQIASGNPPTGAVIAVSESVAGAAGPEKGYSLVAGTTGQVTITSLTANSVTVDFQFDGVGPNSEVQNNPSTGTFSTSGTLTGNFATL